MTDLGAGATLDLPLLTRPLQLAELYAPLDLDAVDEPGDPA